MSYAAIMHIYNNAEYLPTVIPAILNQSEPPTGLYIVDDDSTDNTREIIDSYQIPCITLKDYCETPYKRRANAFDIAQDKARQTYRTAEHFLKVDGDTLIQPDYAEKLLRHMKDPTVAACSGVSTLYHKTRDLNNGAVLYRVRTLPPPRRIYGWDRDIQLRLIKAGYRIKVDPTATYTDLRPPNTMKPPLTRVIKNRVNRRTAALEGWIRRNRKYSNC